MVLVASTARRGPPPFDRLVGLVVKQKWQLALLACFVAVLWWRAVWTTAVPVPYSEGTNVPSKKKSAANSVSLRYASTASTSLPGVTSTVAAKTKTKGTAAAVVSSTAPPSTSQCASQEGVIITNVVGQLANDLFEVAFTNLLAKKLCWKTMYRKWWVSELPSDRGRECLLNAQLPQDHTQFPNISTSLQATMEMNATRWSSLTKQHVVPELNVEYKQWIESLERKGFGMQIVHNKYNFTGDRVEHLVEKLRQPSSKIQVVSLEAFFIHYDWMRHHMQEIREWLSISPKCCQYNPPDDAVVMHVRDFKPDDDGYNGMTPGVYTHILQHYNYTNRPLWIVCQPKTVESQFVQAIVNATEHRNATIIMGQDPYDAFCTLTRAKTLILSFISTYSQMAGLLASPQTTVHYPIDTLQHPKVTLSIPGWKYHLTSPTLNSIQQFDVGYENVISAQN